MKVTLDLDQEVYDLIHEFIEMKYYEALNKFDRSIKTGKYNIFSPNKQSRMEDRTAFEKEVCEYAKWFKIFTDICEQPI